MKLTTAIFLAAMATTVQAGQMPVTVDFNPPDPYKGFVFRNTECNSAIVEPWPEHDDTNWVVGFCDHDFIGQAMMTMRHKFGHPFTLLGFDFNAHGVVVTSSAGGHFTIPGPQTAYQMRVHHGLHLGRYRAAVRQRIVGLVLPRRLRASPQHSALRQLPHLATGAGARSAHTHRHRTRRSCFHPSPRHEHRVGRHSQWRVKHESAHCGDFQCTSRYFCRTRCGRYYRL